jgi:hypothetical protein
MTEQQWALLLPKAPEDRSSSAEISEILQEMVTTRFVDVVPAIFLPVAWPGIIDPEADLQAQLIARIGRWCVTDRGVVCLGEEYWIAADRLDEDEWLEHLLQKDWLYDPSDLTAALDQARALAFPNVDQAERIATIDAELQTAIQYGYLVFHPTALRRHHIYLVQRMQPEEHAAFCTFLANEGFVPRV